MKLALARTLLSLMLLPTAVLAHSQTTTNTYAYGYFTGPDGALALVEVTRTTDVLTRITTTQLFYTFCGQAGLGTACQQGDGTIPNSSVTGGVSANANSPSVVTVRVDTSAVAGFHNQLCVGGIDEYGDCVGATPATGGLVAVTWTKTNEWANVGATANKSYQLGRVSGSSASSLGVFSAGQAGTVLGVSAASGAVMVTSTDSQRLKEKFAALKVRTK